MAVLNPPPLTVPEEFTQSISINKFFDGLLRTIYQMWAEVFSLRFKQKTLTTDATITALQYVAIPVNNTVYIEAIVVARRTGGAAGSAGDGAFYKRAGAFKNIAGVISQIGGTVADTGEDQAAWDCQFASSGQTIAITGTGAVNNNITWESTVSFYTVGV